MNPVISIIVPTYNARNYLSRCIDSLINQTFSHFEIIIVDDGSTDSSLEILNKYQSRFSHIKVLHQKNSGQSVARNNGLKVASGNYIMFVDSDDWVELDICEKLYNLIIEGDSDIAICGINNYFTDKPVEEANLRLFYKNKFLPNFIVTPVAKLYKSSYWFNNKFRFHEGIFYEDFDLLPRVLFLTDKIKFLDMPLYNYERRNQNSTTNIRKKSDYVFLIMDRLYSFYQKQKSNRDFEIFYLQYMFNLFYTYNIPENRDKIKKLLSSKRSMMKPQNCLNRNQQILAKLFLLKVPLSLIWAIVKLRNKDLK